MFIYTDNEMKKVLGVNDTIIALPEELFDMYSSRERFKDAPDFVNMMSIDEFEEQLHIHCVTCVCINTAEAYEHFVQLINTEPSFVDIKIVNI